MNDVPAVDMLWESADPRQALTGRFGFRDGAAAADWVADVLQRYWELDVVRCDRLVISDRNVVAWVQAGGRRLITKWSSLEGDLLDVDDPGHIDDAGRMLATMHHAFAAYPGRHGRRGRGERAQLLHNDFRSANILHDGTSIAAVLDFEEITCDARVADIAWSAVLLGTRYRDWGPTSESVRAAYVDAYDRQAHDPLTTSERQEIDARVAALLKSFGWM